MCTDTATMELSMYWNWQPTWRQIKIDLAKLAAMLLVLVLPYSAFSAQACPSVGAIRWDAWFGDDGVPGLAVQKSLGPKEWHARLPVCSQVSGDNEVHIDCMSPQQLAKESDQARAAGLDYWAFVTYPEDSPMNKGLSAYLRLSDPKKIRFAVISEFEKWGTKDSFLPVLHRYINLMKEHSYQRTPEGRPLFFLAFVTDASLNFRFDDRAGYARVLAEFRRQAMSSQLGNPYIVLLDGNVQHAKSLTADLGLDAVSAYAIADNRVVRGTYEQLTKLAEMFWADSSASGMPLLPVAMTGWDRRPRAQNPVPWEKKSAKSNQMLNYFDAPTPAQLTRHISAAIRAAQSGVPSLAANSVLIYAWNEFDEGGWLAPTLGDGTTRLDAVRRAIDATCPTGGTPR